MCACIAPTHAMPSRKDVQHTLVGLSEQVVAMLKRRAPRHGLVRDDSLQCISLRACVYTHCIAGGARCCVWRRLRRLTSGVLVVHRTVTRVVCFVAQVTVPAMGKLTTEKVWMRMHDVCAASNRAGECVCACGVRGDRQRPSDLSSERR